MSPKILNNTINRNLKNKIRKMDFSLGLAQWASFMTTSEEGPLGPLFKLSQEKNKVADCLGAPSVASNMSKKMYIFFVFIK